MLRWAPCSSNPQDNAACSVWIFYLQNNTCVVAVQSSFYTLDVAEGVSVGFVGNTLDSAFALYHTVPGLWCPEQLVKAGEVNTMLGYVTNEWLPIFVSGGANGLVRWKSMGQLRIQ